MSIRLKKRIVNPINFTSGDEALLALVDMIECPLDLDIADDMITFNKNCYDNKYFEVLRKQAVDRNVSFTDSGYARNDCRCLAMENPQTGEVFEYHVAMNTLYFKYTCPRFKLKRILLHVLQGYLSPDLKIHTKKFSRSKHQ